MDSAILLTVLGLSLACLGLNLALFVGCRRQAAKVRHAHRLSDEVTEIQDSVGVLRGLMKRMQGRNAMRDYREEKVDAFPDPKKQPAQWLAAMERKIRDGEHKRVQNASGGGAR